MRNESIPGAADDLGENARIRENRHEVMISVPTGNQVYVYVLVDTGSRGATEIDTDVQCLCVRRLLQSDGTFANETEDLVVYAKIDRFERGAMIVGDDH
jgi:hypothetical protein